MENKVINFKEKLDKIKREQDDSVMVSENYDSVVVANYIDPEVWDEGVSGEFDVFPPLIDDKS